MHLTLLIVLGVIFGKPGVHFQLRHGFLLNIDLFYVSHGVIESLVVGFLIYRIPDMKVLIINWCVVILSVVVGFVDSFALPIFDPIIKHINAIIPFGLLSAPHLLFCVRHCFKYVILVIIRFLFWY